MNATAAEQAARADLVFVGAAVDVRAPARADSVQFLFAVEEVRKGPTLASAVVATAANGAACGAGFTVDTRWLVFATRSGDAWASTLCSGNQPLGAAAGVPSDAAEWPDQAEQAAQGDANPALPLQSFVMIVVVALLAAGLGGRVPLARARATTALRAADARRQRNAPSSRLTKRAIANAGRKAAIRSVRGQPGPPNQA